MKELVLSDLFQYPGRALGPLVSGSHLFAAEKATRVVLPRLYREIIQIQNGGLLRRKKVLTNRPTSWAPNHFEVHNLLGIGYEDGLDGEFGSEYLKHEWGYPDIGVVVFDTPAAGHDTVMLDYSKCGTAGEPQVVYVDEDRSILKVANSFEEFLALLF